jgi:hypothetical protein
MKRPSLTDRVTTREPQQHTLSIRVSDTLRLRLERVKQLMMSTTGNQVSTSAIAKQFLESAREERLEVVELLAHLTDTLLQIRRKGDAGSSYHEPSGACLRILCGTVSRRLPA